MDQELRLFTQNMSHPSSFILLGFTDLPGLHYPLLLSFCLMYSVTITGNSLILALISIHPALQTPMYFFLCNLGVLDICCTSVTLPRLIKMQSGGDRTISFASCVSQQYFFISFTVSEFFLLAAMAYDRYVAICDPLHYCVVVNRKIIIILANLCWLVGFITAWVPVYFTVHFYFCGPHIINHFFCDLAAMLKLSCSKTRSLQFVIFAESMMLALFPFLFTLSSYIGIIRTILRIKSVKGRHRTFSTCASHLTVVMLFYGTLIGVYMRPSSMYSPANDKLFALLYTAVIPMLNPIIYTLRNGDVKDVLKKYFGNNNS